jgi:hypothetical protein
LYDAYSKRIMLALLPPYLVHLLLVNIQIFVNESMRDYRQQLQEMAEGLEKDEMKTEFDKMRKFSDSVVFICGIFNILNSFVFLMQSKSLGMQIFVRVWSIVDFFIIVTNFITVLNLYISFGTEKIRVIETVLILM